jgi:hypothetical protein
LSPPKKKINKSTKSTKDTKSSIQTRSKAPVPDLTPSRVQGKEKKTKSADLSLSPLKNMKPLDLQQTIHPPEPRGATLVAMQTIFESPEAIKLFKPTEEDLDVVHCLKRRVSLLDDAINSKEGQGQLYCTSQEIHL